MHAFVTRLLSFLSCAILASLHAAHATPLVGPKGGRILTTAAPHAEFFVTTDRHVIVTFYDANLQPLAPAEQTVAAIAEVETGKVKLAFAKTAKGFRSEQPLPAGEGYRVVVQIRQDPNARPANYRVDYHTETCPECARAEYACTCEGHVDGDDDHGHAH